MGGGRHVNVPCSHAAHSERPGLRNYRMLISTMNVDNNFLRIVESLFDPAYKETFYYYNPSFKVGVQNDMLCDD